MSRVGEKPIPVPANVKVKVEGGSVLVEGPNGKLRTELPEGIRVEVGDKQLLTKRENDLQAPNHGLARTLVANSIIGVTDGFKRELDIVGIGYRAEIKGKNLVFALGFSHPIEFLIPEGVSIAVEKQTHIVVSSPEKQKVGQVAADIRALRPPDPYKNKGIRYTGERLRKKVGKTAVGSTTK